MQIQRLKLLVAVGLWASLLLVAGGVASAQRLYTFGSAGPGGVWYTMVGGMTTLLTNELDGVVFTPDVTGGSVANARLVCAGEQDMALVHATHLYQLMNGEGVFAGTRCNDFRGVAEAYYSYHYFVTLKETGIRTMKDLAGKRVNLGAAGSGSADNSRVTLEILGIEPAESLTMGFSEAATALRDGRIHAIAQSGAPATGIVELAATSNIYIIPYTEEELDAIVSQHPYWSKGVLPANVYEGQTEPVPMWFFSIYWVAHKDMPAEDVYRAIKVAFSDEGRAYLATVHPEWRNMRPNLQGMANINLQLHPGAERFWRERGEL